MKRSHALALADGDVDAMPARPRIRRDCVGGVRPCPWVSCAYHVVTVEIGEDGAIAVDHAVLAGDADATEVDRFTTRAAELVANLRSDSCVLDVVDREPDGCTLEQVGRRMRVTRERVRQIESKALARGVRPARRHVGDGLAPTPGPAALDVRNRLDEP